MPLRHAVSYPLYLRTVVLAMSLLGCEPAPRPDAGAPDPKADRAAILAQSQQLSAAYVQGDIDALVAVYADDGIAAPAGRDFVRGDSALRALWALPEGRSILRHAATPVELTVDGDHAYDWGYYEGQAAQEGEPLPPFRGAYTIVWERGADGVWRIAMDMWYGLPQ